MLMQSKKIDEEINELLEQEDVKQRQRAKHNWYQLRDKYTNYFHKYASWRQRKNRIAMIQDDQGQHVLGRTEIEEVFSNYFHRLFQTSNPSQTQLDN